MSKSNRMLKCLFPCCSGRPMAPTGVRINVSHQYVLIDNGIIQLVLSNPGGIITGIQYNGVDNLLEILNKEDNRGYWDIVWNDPGKPGIFDVIKGTKFSIIQQDDDQVEVSFTRMWDPSLQGKAVPLNIDKRFIVLRGSSGFYTYAIYEHLEGWPDFSLGETRVAFKLRKDKFQYMAISDSRQRVMPLPDDRIPPRGQPLAYPEAVLLTNPINPNLKSEVDDKYQYSCKDKDIKVHGWISFDPPVGFWQITPSDEFRTGGPLKQDLTSHVGPTTLAMFMSSHYAGQELSPTFTNGEYWKKVFGPVFMYFNSSFDGSDPTLLWDDAKVQMQIEVESWPYCFPASDEFEKAWQRGSVSGTLLVRDRYIDDGDIYASGAYIGLALPGEAGSWQRECKGYQFWTRADEFGNFSICNVLTGDYNLYAFIPGFIGDYKFDSTISISSGNDIYVGEIVYEPPRDGPTIWEIGVADRSAAEFYIPDPSPIYVNRLYINHPDRFRQYGLWDRYTELYNENDLVYIVGESDYTKDWFFAHVNRKSDDGSYKAATWQIKFQLESVDQNSTYKFRVALASAALSELQVRFNDPTIQKPHFTTGLIGRDNSIARHGIHGLYWLYNIDVQSSLLMQGENIIYLTQTRTNSPFQGLMYDYLRFEGPPVKN
ncbi:hypothetical protein LUZ60_011969 [Juncus effusus]|nr:hypothetical protein LUZ60_011969 [Juncus effusus]